MSLPGACLQEMTSRKVSKLLGTTQMGIGVAAGPETLLTLGKTLAALHPDDAFCALDVHNAFGEVSRAEVMEEVLDELPEIANYLMNMWGASQLVASVIGLDHIWAHFICVFVVYHCRY